MNFFEFNRLFHTELDCINYFKNIRYKTGLRCNHCGSSKVYHLKKYPKVFKCPSCKNDFSIFKDTIFEKSDTDLRKWFYAIHLFLNSKKGISGYQLQREIGVTYKCAWRILKKIREAMSNSETKDMFNGMIEVDEAYVGKDDEDDDTPPKRGRGTNKNVVVGVLDRDNKIVKAEVMKKNLNGSKINSEQLLSVINRIIKDDTTIITDEFKGYNLVSKSTNHKHLRVNHSKSYVDEFCFRYNNKSNGDVFNLVLRQSILI